MKWSNGQCVGALENSMEGGQWSGRSWYSRKVVSGGCGFTERREDRVGPGQVCWEVKGVSSGGRRSRWGSHASSSGLLWQYPANSPVRTTRLFMGVLKPEAKTVCV